MASSDSWRRSDVPTAIATAVLYGVLAQLVIRLHWCQSLHGVMSLGYVFVLPCLLGFLTVLNLAAPFKRLGTVAACCATSVMCLAIAFLVGWESSICLVMAAPVYFTLSILGGQAGAWVRARLAPSVARLSRPQRAAVALLLLTPLLSALLESQLHRRAETRLVTSSIEIEASPEQVWGYIARVLPIQEPDHRLFFSLGFPRPIEATLSHDGLGGVRNARFEHGLCFIETVTYWDPPRSIRFAIAPDPNQAALSTLDEHVLAGGRYFDVREGTYRIEPLGRTGVRLHLTSEHAINTHFNAYTALWSDYLMAEIQQSILLVIKQRAERARVAERS